MVLQISKVRLLPTLAANDKTHAHRNLVFPFIGAANLPSSHHLKRQAQGAPKMGYARI